MNGHILSVALSILAFAGSAEGAAKQPIYSPTYQSCLTQTRNIDAATRVCQDAELARMDGDLNKVYRALMARIDKTDPDLKTPLQTAERSWLTYRDAECKFYMPIDSDQVGTLDFVIHNDCLLKLTDQRIKDLADELKRASH